ncbi:MAG: hypothetical protein KAI53_05380, partial [Candidatus Aenigmarchaeota archaeon]|nr:hypothetical protein [Candidatus Aenigmarchaeota archaeon]
MLLIDGKKVISMILTNLSYQGTQSLKEKDFFKDENFVNWFELFQNSESFKPIYDAVSVVENDSIKAQKAVNSILL